MLISPMYEGKGRLKIVVSIPTASITFISIYVTQLGEEISTSIGGSKLIHGMFRYYLGLFQ